MKLSGFTLANLTRETRVALLTAFLFALGTIVLDQGWRAAGLAFIIAAAALAVAFYLFVIGLDRALWLGSTTPAFSVLAMKGCAIAPKIFGAGLRQCARSPEQHQNKDNRKPARISATVVVRNSASS